MNNRLTRQQKSGPLRFALAQPLKSTYQVYLLIKNHNLWSKKVDKGSFVKIHAKGHEKMSSLQTTLYYCMARAVRFIGDKQE